MFFILLLMEKKLIKNAERKLFFKFSKSKYNKQYIQLRNKLSVRHVCMYVHMKNIIIFDLFFI